jgi:hypothetical protein
MSTPVDEAFCSQDINKFDERCSCYNVIERDCEKESDIPGCKEALEYVDSVVSVIPETQGPHKAVARLGLMQRLYCPGRVCVGENKYKPPIIDDLRKTAPCGFNLDMCVQNTQIDTALDTEVKTECKINENFIGTDPWELDFEEDEKDDIERLKKQQEDRIELRKLELDAKKKENEEKQKLYKLYTYGGVGIFILLLIIIMFVMR